MGIVRAGRLAICTHATERFSVAGVRWTTAVTAHAARAWRSPRRSASSYRHSEQILLSLRSAVLSWAREAKRRVSTSLIPSTPSARRSTNGHEYVHNFKNENKTACGPATLNCASRGAARVSVRAHNSRFGAH